MFIWLKYADPEQKANTPFSRSNQLLCDLKWEAQPSNKLGASP